MYDGPDESSLGSRRSAIWSGTDITATEIQTNYCSCNSLKTFELPLIGLNYHSYVA